MKSSPTYSVRVRRNHFYSNAGVSLNFVALWRLCYRSFRAQLGLRLFESDVVKALPRLPADRPLWRRIAYCSYCSQSERNPARRYYLYLDGKLDRQSQTDRQTDRRTAGVFIDRRISQSSCGCCSSMVARRPGVDLPCLPSANTLVSEPTTASSVKYVRKYYTEN